MTTKMLKTVKEKMMNLCNNHVSTISFNFNFIAILTHFVYNVYDKINTGKNGLIAHSLLTYDSLRKMRLLVER